jgi:hypothetical protein
MAQQDWFTAFRDVSQNIAGFLPALLGAALLVLVGLLFGRLLAWVSRRTMAALVARLSRHPSLQGALDGGAAVSRAPTVIAGFVFWVVFVFFLAAALETMGLPVVTSALSRIAYYLPNVLAALLVTFVGIIGAKVMGNAAGRAAARTGTSLGPAIGATVRGTVILVAAVVAVEQIGIQADILIVVVAVVVGTTLAGAGLAFGLGARTAVSNIIASHYVAQAYHVGQVVRVAGVQGKILQTTPTAVFVAGPDGRVMIPAKQFNEEASVLVTAS